MPPLKTITLVLTLLLLSSCGYLGNETINERSKKDAKLESSINLTTPSKCYDRVVFVDAKDNFGDKDKKKKSISVANGANFCSTADALDDDDTIVIPIDTTRSPEDNIKDAYKKYNICDGARVFVIDHGCRFIGEDSVSVRQQFGNEYLKPGCEFYEECRENGVDEIVLTGCWTGEDKESCQAIADQCDATVYGSQGCYVHHWISRGPWKGWAEYEPQE